jgi:hypothetical protein
MADTQNKYKTAKRISADKDCIHGCNQQIHFDDSAITERGRYIPLSVFDEPHDCPKSPYKGRK